jgi:catechol 2,3-dioxygenase-like lactoylglutathione lyase family enzyme
MPIVLKPSSTYDIGTAYGHIAIGVDDLDATLAELATQGIEPERPPYSVREGGSRLCFVRDPDAKLARVNDRFAQPAPAI